MKSERTYPVYKVNKHAEGLLVGGHPWVYKNDILEAPGTTPENGSLVDVVSPKGAYLGTGFLSLKSKIRVRLISRNANDTFDTAFWRRRVEYAWAYRKTVLEPADLSACRFIFGEADQFPGLTVDRFNNVLVTQTLSVGMERLKPVLFPLLAEVLRADGQTIDGIYERNDEALRAKEGLEQNKGWFALPGESHPETTQTEICENGVYYHVDFENGQKTGFFLDQKYNRRAVARLAAGLTMLPSMARQTVLSFNGEVTWRPASSFRTELGVHGYIYNDDETKLHNGAPAFDGNFSAHYDGRKISFGAGIWLQSTRKWSDYQLDAASGAESFGSVEVPFAADLRVNFDWKVSGRITLFAEGRNLINRRLYQYPWYPEYGANFTVGVKANF